MFEDDKLSTFLLNQAKANVQETIVKLQSLQTTLHMFEGDLIIDGDAVSKFVGYTIDDLRLLLEGDFMPKDLGDYMTSLDNRKNVISDLGAESERIDQLAIDMREEKEQQLKLASRDFLLQSNEGRIKVMEEDLDELIATLKQLEYIDDIYDYSVDEDKMEVSFNLKKGDVDHPFFFNLSGYDGTTFTRINNGVIQTVLPEDKHVRCTMKNGETGICGTVFPSVPLMEIHQARLHSMEYWDNKKKSGWTEKDDEEFRKAHEIIKKVQSNNHIIDEHVPNFYKYHRQEEEE